MRNGDSVIHMIPAAGYYAVYREGDDLTYNPVAARVVIEDEQAGNAWTALIPAVTTGRDRHAANGGALSSSSIEMSESGVDNTFLDLRGRCR
jgi:hypothetical protein